MHRSLRYDTIVAKFRQSRCTMMDRTIFCFGDSNTSGYAPRSYLGDRYPREMRWPGLLDSHPDWQVKNQGQNGRAIPCHSGELTQLRHQLDRFGPLDVMTVMLGSNDLLQSPGFTALDTASRMETFLCQLLAFPSFSQRKSRLLLICPPPMRPGTWVQEERLLAESASLGDAYSSLARKLDIAFADARNWGIPLLFDGVHFSPEGHRCFAQQIVHVLEPLLEAD